LAKAFCDGTFLAIGPPADMTGLLSDEPALAAQIARLAQLSPAPRRRIWPMAVFLDNRGLKAEGGDAYVFASDAGLAVDFGERPTVRQNVSVELAPEVEGKAYSCKRAPSHRRREGAGVLSPSSERILAHGK